MGAVGDGLGTGADLVAAAEVAARQALGPLRGERPDLVCVFVSGGDPELVARAGSTAVRLAGARASIGCGASGVIGAGRGIEQAHAVAVWAARLPDATVRPVRLGAHRTGDSMLVTGLPESSGDDQVGVLLVDPYTFPVGPFVAHCNTSRPGLPLVGGLAGGVTGAGATRLFLDDEVLTAGAVGLVLGGACVCRVAVSQGCRPIGPPMTVTRSERHLLLELAGTPAFEKLRQIVAELPSGEQDLALHGLQLGVVMNEYAETHQQGDFLIRGVLGVDERSGAVAVGDAVEVGATVQFQVRDAAAAEADLGAALTGIGPVDGALLFSCNGRGRAMFPDADHDVAAVRRALGVDAVAGFFAGGEIGPVAGRNHVHGFTASILAVGSPDR